MHKRSHHTLTVHSYNITITKGHQIPISYVSGVCDETERPLEVETIILVYLLNAHVIIVGHTMY